VGVVYALMLRRGLKPAASQKYTQVKKEVKIMEITLFLKKEMSNPILELFGWKIE
jgi:hypothetical protein